MGEEEPEPSKSNAVHPLLRGRLLNLGTLVSAPSPVEGTAVLRVRFPGTPMRRSVLMLSPSNLEESEDAEEEFRRIELKLDN